MANVYRESTDPQTNPENASKKGYDRGDSSGKKYAGPRIKQWSKKNALGKAPSADELPRNSIDWNDKNAWATVDMVSLERDGSEPKIIPTTGMANNILKTMGATNLIPSDSKTVSIKCDQPLTITTPGGIAVLQFKPTMGASTNENTDPVNRACNSVYSYITNTLFNTNPPYWKAYDVGLYAFRISNIVMMLDWLRLLILAAMQDPLYNQEQVMPVAYYKSCRITGSMDTASDMWGAYGAWKDIYDRSKHYRSRYNRLVDMVNNLRIPDGLPIFHSYGKMLDGFYADSADTDHAQLYGFAPIGFWKYVEDRPDPDKPKTWSGKLEFYDLFAAHAGDDGLWTVDDLMDQVEAELTKAIFHSDIPKEIGNSIFTAYGSENLWKYPMYITRESSMPPTWYSEDVLLSIENAVIVNDLKDWTIYGDIMQAKLVGRPQMDWNTTFNALQHFVNLPLRFPAGFKGTPGFDKCAIALKFHPIAGFIQNWDNSPEGEVHPCIDFGVAFSDAIIVGIRMSYRNPITQVNVEDQWKTFQIDNRVATEQKILITSDWAHFPIFITGWVGDGDTDHPILNIDKTSGDRTIEVPINYDGAFEYFKSMTEYGWGSEVTRSAKALYSTSARQATGL